MNIAVLEFFFENVSLEEFENKRVIEVGSKYVNGSVRPFIEKFLRPAEYIGVDIEEGKFVDVICNAENLVDYFGKESFDVLISTELLEHVRDWVKVINNFKLILKHGGFLYITTRSKGFPYHGYPYDFWRFEIYDMKQIFRDFEIIKLVPDHQDPGVFLKARKPKDYQEPINLDDYLLYSIIFNKKVTIDVLRQPKKLLGGDVGGHVDVFNEEGIEGWLLDITDKDPYFLIKVNGVVAYRGKPTLERIDIKVIYNVNWNTGFKVRWKDIKLSEEILSLPDSAELDVKVVHERTGYIIPGNYKKISKKALIEKITQETINLKIIKSLTAGKLKIVYSFINNLDKIKEIKPTTLDTSVFIQRDGKDWNVLCVAPKEQNRIKLEVFYNNGEKEEVSLTV